MSKFKVVGIRSVSFTDKDSGNNISGKTLFVTHRVDGVIGEEGKKYFLRNDIDVSKISIGDSVDIFFNDRGKVDALIPLGKQ